MSSTQFKLKREKEIEECRFLGGFFMNSFELLMKDKTLDPFPWNLCKTAFLMSFAK